MGCKYCTLVLFSSKEWMVVDGSAFAAATRMPITRIPATRLTVAPAAVMINRCHTGFLLKALGSSDSSSSPAMLTKPPKGSKRSE